jgi:hypothetical protein
VRRFFVCTVCCVLGGGGVYVRFYYLVLLELYVSRWSGGMPCFSTFLYDLILVTLCEMWIFVVVG